MAKKNELSKKKNPSKTEKSVTKEIVSKTNNSTKKTNSTKKASTNKKIPAKETIVSAGNELSKLSTILVCVIGVVCVFYILTTLIAKSRSDLHYVPNNQISQISYTEILGSDILKKDGTYYVLVEDKEDPYVNLFEKYIAKYEDLKVYTVDLNTAFNQNYKAENTDAKNLKFAGTTLLKISDGEVVDSYDDNEDINDHLKSLIVE